jgi:hypothetical protein
LFGTVLSAPFNLDGLRAAGEAMFSFSFVPHNWEGFYGRWLVFGSLFSLTLPCLRFVRGACGRVAWLYALSLSAVFIWFMFSHWDRYLVAVVPWMAAATAVMFVLIARSAFAARAGMILLVALQVIWAGDIPFIRTHNQINESPFRRVALFLASAYERQPHRLDVYEPLSTIGRAIPKGATVLARDNIMILGLDRNWVSDLHQLAFNYARLGSPAAIHDELVHLGVTHVLWPTWSIGRDSLAEDLAFYNYVLNYGVGRQAVGGQTFVALPPTRPTATESDYNVALHGCGAPYQTGWYLLSQLTLPVLNPGPPPIPIDSVVTADVARADFVVVDAHCNPGLRPGPEFTWVASRGENQIFVRSPPRAR